MEVFLFGLNTSIFSLMSFTPDFYFFFICFFVSLTVYFQKGSELYLRLMPVYMGIAIAVQFYGTYLAHHHQHNVRLYNLFSIAEFTFLFYVLRTMILSKRMRNFILVALIVFPLAGLLNIFYYQTDSYHSISYTIGCLLIVVFCIFYFVELFQLTVAPNLLRDPAFWICTSILFSNVCTFPLWSMFNLMKNLRQGLLMKLFYIQIVINIFSYLIYIIAFVCRIRVRKSTL